MLDPIDIFNAFKPHRGVYIRNRYDPGNGGKALARCKRPAVEGHCAGRRDGTHDIGGIRTCAGAAGREGGAVRRRGFAADEPGRDSEHRGGNSRRTSYTSCWTTSATRRPVDSRYQTRRISTMQRWRRARDTLMRTTLMTSRTSRQASRTS